jgi:membrane peptidoglycan carboxypeptidase
MEVYLNSIEMGMEFMGAQAASDWYRKTADLTPIQAAGIADSTQSKKIYGNKFIVIY